MSALHAALVAALDAESEWAGAGPGRSKERRLVKHQRNVLARHAETAEGWCDRCRTATRWPCPDVRDLAGMLDVELDPC